MRKTCFFVGIVAGLIVISVLAMQGCNDGGAKSGGPGSTGLAGGGFVFKEKLSEYGFFVNKLSDLQPAPGVLPYELVTPLFTDYAVKDRFIVLPAGQTIRYTAQGVLDFPDSTILVKNFAYRNPSNQKILIETRLLVKDPQDKRWEVMDYLWKEDQSDAIRHITGARIPITLLDDRGDRISTIYQVPNTNDCKRCHINNDVLTPIGPKARNLNFVRARAETGPGRGGVNREDTGFNQLVIWAKQGRLSGLPAIGQVERLPGWKDSLHFSVGQRARAYLDVNCAHCHTRGGDAYNTGLFLEYQQTDPEHIGILKAPVSAGGGAGGLNYDIIPGDATHSILAYRMNSTEPGTAMPELARTVIHQEAVALIRNWIDQLPRKRPLKKLQQKEQ
ncbi:MAG: SO2930 family diheme c-type cytochrome [Puia sp.]|nr:SO2930 family diheme c-type cytochrome [Puia sp.]